QQLYAVHPLLTHVFSAPTPLSPPDLPSLPTRRSSDLAPAQSQSRCSLTSASEPCADARVGSLARALVAASSMRWKATKALAKDRSEEDTSELQSRGHLVCRLLLEKKKKKQ